MRIVLAAYGLSESDFSLVYLKPVFTQEKMAQNELQGFAMMAGAPMKAVTQLSDKANIIPQGHFETILH